MARVLVDTNLLARRFDSPSALRPVAKNALRVLRGRGDELVIAPQTLYELWIVLTRPTTARGGFGFTPSQAVARIEAIGRAFVLLPDSPAILPAWLDLVTRYKVSGTKAHDARLVAAMKVSGVALVLTFNTPDFQGFASEGITVLDPRTL